MVISVKCDSTGEFYVYREFQRTKEGQRSIKGLIWWFTLKAYDKIITFTCIYEYFEMEWVIFMAVLE